MSGSLSVSVYVCLSVSVCMSCRLSVQVLFNLANQYAANDMDNEALNTYNIIIKTKDFNNSGKSLPFMQDPIAAALCTFCLY